MSIINNSTSISSAFAILKRLDISGSRQLRTIHQLCVCKNIVHLYERNIKGRNNSTCLFPRLVIQRNISCTVLGRQFISSNINCGTLTPCQKRHKSKKYPKRPEYDSDSDDEEEEEVIQGTKVATIRVQSLRMDALLKKALNIARNKVEAAFYEGNVRVNGNKPDKKGYQLRIGDEVDLIKGISPMNPEFLSVSRVEVISVKEPNEENDDQLYIKVRRTKTLYIENYESQPWKKSTESE